jgi:hypothetical protein
MAAGLDVHICRSDDRSAIYEAAEQGAVGGLQGGGGRGLDETAPGEAAAGDGAVNSLVKTAPTRLDTRGVGGGVGAAGDARGGTRAPAGAGRRAM